MNTVFGSDQVAIARENRPGCVTPFTHYRSSIVRILAIAGFSCVTACTDTSDAVAVGTVERDRVELTTTFSEPIVAHHVREGDSVVAGTLISEQSAVRLTAQLARAEAERDRAAARLAELIRGPRKELIREAIARLDRTEALRRDAALEFKRVSDLVDKGFASIAQLDQLKAQRDSAAATLAEAQAALDSMTAGTTAEELAQARYALGAAEASVSELTESRTRLTHIAPVDSLVESLPYEEGETPPIGAPVAVLLRSGAPYARVYVPEALRASVHPGDSAQIQVDGVERTFAGRVRFVSAEASFTPYFALTRHDRGRLVFVGEIDLLDATDLPAGVPVEAHFSRE